MTGRGAMNCEEFEALATDFESDSIRAAEAKEHLRNCVRCASLFQVQQELREGLRVLARETESVQTPSRVEAALLERVRAKRPMLRWNRRISVLGWAAAVATTVFAFWLSSHQWMRSHRSAPIEAKTLVAPSPVNPPAANRESSAKALTTEPALGHRRKSSSSRTEVAGHSHLGRFVALPYTTQGSDGGDAFVMRVRMTRASLDALGLPVNEERAGESIQVDLLVGADGQPQAVRFLR